MSIVKIERLEKNSKKGTNMDNMKIVKDFIREMVKTDTICTNMGIVEVDGRGYILSASIKDLTDEIPSLEKREIK